MLVSLWETGILILCLWEYKMYSHFRQKFDSLSIKIKKPQTLDLATSFSIIYSRETLTVSKRGLAQRCSLQIHNRKKMGITLPINKKA